MANNQDEPNRCEDDHYEHSSDEHGWTLCESPMASESDLNTTMMLEATNSTAEHTGNQSPDPREIPTPFRERSSSASLGMINASATNELAMTSHLLAGSRKRTATFSESSLGPYNYKERAIKKAKDDRKERMDWWIAKDKSDPRRMLPFRKDRQEKYEGHHCGKAPNLRRLDGVLAHFKTEHPLHLKEAGTLASEFCHAFGVDQIGSWKPLPKPKQ